MALFLKVKSSVPPIFTIRSDHPKLHQNLHLLPNSGSQRKHCKKCNCCPLFIQIQLCLLWNLTFQEYLIVFGPGVYSSRSEHLAEAPTCIWSGLQLNWTRSMLLNTSEQSQRTFEFQTSLSQKTGIINTPGFLNLYFTIQRNIIKNSWNVAGVRRHKKQSWICNIESCRLDFVVIKGVFCEMEE